MAEMRHGQTLDVLTGLGNGYDSSKAGTSPVLIGGGVGIPPLYGLLKALQRQRAAGGLANGESAGTEKIRVILGFNTAEEIFYQNEFEAAGAEVLLATADGSAGVKGFVTDVLAGLDYSYFYTCLLYTSPAVSAVCQRRQGAYHHSVRQGKGYPDSRDPHGGRRGQAGACTVRRRLLSGLQPLRRTASGNRVRAGFSQQRGSHRVDVYKRQNWKHMSMCFS